MKRDRVKRGESNAEANNKYHQPTDERRGSRAERSSPSAARIHRLGVTGRYCTPEVLLSLRTLFIKLYQFEHYCGRMGIVGVCYSTITVAGYGVR